MLSMIDNNILFDHQRCCQCGTCVPACPKSALETLQRDDGTLGITCNSTKCVSCGLCVKVCPSVRLPAQLVNEEYIRSVSSIELAWAKDAKTRFRASSGGVARSVVCSLLESKGVDAVYMVIKEDSSRDFAGRYCTTLEQCHAVANSRYHPVQSCLGLGEMPVDVKRLLIVGTPCQLQGAVAFMKAKYPTIELFTIAILCKQQKTLDYSKFMKRWLGVARSVEPLEYRGKGWPGYCSCGDSKIHWETAAALPFGKELWRVNGCRFCGDLVGMNVADLTLADPWKIITEREADGGMNLLFCWSSKGEMMLKTAAERIAKHPITADDALVSLDWKNYQQKQIRINDYLKYLSRKKTGLRFHCGEYQRCLYEKLLLKIKSPTMIIKIINKIPFIR